MESQQSVEVPGALTLSQVERLVKTVTPLVPLEHAVWSAKEIADYLHVSARHVTERLSMRPDFPTPRRTDPGSKRGHLRWQAIEVVEWWEKQERV